MRTLNLKEMEGIEGGSNRQCAIDGLLTVGGVILGVATGGWLGAGIGLLGGLYAANSNGCF